MVSRRIRVVSTIFLAVLVFTSLAVPFTSAQESPVAGEPLLQQDQLLSDSSLRAEPTTESPELEFLTAGTTVTLMDEPFVSSLDGQLWVQVATLRSLGYLLQSAFEPEVEPVPDETAPGEPTITHWDAIRDPNGAACRAEPNWEAAVLLDLVAGQEVGLTAEAAGDWHPTLCAGTQGYLPVTAFIDPAPVETPVSTPTLEPTPEITETVEPAASEVALIPTEPAVAEASSPDPAAAATAEFVVEVAALVSGTTVVSGTDGDGVRCRSGASTSSSTIVVLSEGAAVTVRGAASAGWQPVYCAGQNGFVWAIYLAGGGSDSSGNQSTGFGQVRNTDGDGLRCRSGAGLTSAVITILSPGSVVPTRGASQDVWQPVTCANQAGWVHTDYFGPASGSQNSGSSNSAGSAQHSFVSGQSARVSGTDGDGVRFRSGASLTSATISVLSEGTGVSVRAGSTGPWVAVSFGGSNGFVHMDYLSRSSGASSGTSSSNLATGSNAVVEDHLRLRSGPGYTSSTLAVAPTGAVVRITGSPTNGFYPVRWDDMHGYMHGDYLSWTSRALTDRTAAPVSSTTSRGNAGSGSGSASGQSIVNYAMRYLGYPYVWAGRGPNSFDCAGFLYWVAYNVTGINLVGGVINQWTYGRPVPYGQLQPGDLVFFQNTYTTGLSHNGIYIGNNQFIHASNPTDGVRISNLTSPYYASRWYGARRLT